jgi:two-component system chemotaxis response regulator CheB
VEGALWAALRALEDRADLARRMATRAEDAGRDLSAKRYREDVSEFTGSVDTLRRLLHYNEGQNGRPDPDGTRRS